MNPAMMNPRMAMMNRMPHMMTPHGPMGNLPMGMMGGNRGPPGMGMSGPPGGPPMGMGPGGPGMPTSGQFNPMSSPGPNPMGMNTDSGTGPGIPPSGQSGPGGPGGPGQPGQVPPTSVSMPNNWPMMNGNQPTPFNPQQFNQQQPPPPTSVSDFNPSSFGDINPSSFNSTAPPTTSGAGGLPPGGALPPGQPATNPAVNNPTGQSQSSNTPALPDLDTSNLDGLDIPTGVDTTTPNSQSAMDINNILGNLTSDAPPSATGGNVVAPSTVGAPPQTAPPSGDVGLAPPVSTSSLPTSIPSSVPNPSEPNPTQIQPPENVEKVPTPPSSIAPPPNTTTPQPTTDDQQQQQQPMTDSVAPSEPAPSLQGATPQPPIGLETTDQSNPNNEPTETE